MEQPGQPTIEELMTGHEEAPEERADRVASMQQDFVATAKARAEGNYSLRQGLATREGYPDDLAGKLILEARLLALESQQPRRGHGRQLTSGELHTAIELAREEAEKLRESA